MQQNQLGFGREEANRWREEPVTWMAECWILSHTGRGLLDNLEWVHRTISRRAGDLQAMPQEGPRELGCLGERRGALQDCLKKEPICSECHMGRGEAVREIFWLHVKNFVGAIQPWNSFLTVISNSLE